MIDKQIMQGFRYDFDYDSIETNVGSTEESLRTCWDHAAMLQKYFQA